MCERAVLLFNEYINISKINLKSHIGKKAPNSHKMIETPFEYIDFIQEIADFQYSGFDLMS